MRSPDTFVLRRAQILPASARGEHTGTIAMTVGFSAQGIRQVIYAFAHKGLSVLQPRPTTPHTVAYWIAEKRASGH